MRQETDYRRWLYVFRFEDGSIYIGITKDPVRRLSEHRYSGKLAPKIRSMLYRYCLTSRSYDEKVAVRMETRLIQAAIRDGSNLINQKTSGTVGSRPRHTLGSCYSAASTYETRIAFCTNDPKRYHAARRNGWLNTICSHMKPQKVNPFTWNYETCALEALKYQNRLDFNRYSSGAYTKARKNGFLNAICAHMPLPNRKFRSDRGRPRIKID